MSDWQGSIRGDYYTPHIVLDVCFIGTRSAHRYPLGIYV